MRDFKHIIIIIIIIIVIICPDSAVPDAKHILLFLNGMSGRHEWGIYMSAMCVGCSSAFEAVKTRAPTKSCAALEASHTPIVPAVRSLLSSHRHANNSQSNHPWDVVCQKACFIGAWKMSRHLWPAVCLCL